MGERARTRAWHTERKCVRTQRESASPALGTHRLLDGLRGITSGKGVKLCGARGVGGGNVELWTQGERAWLKGVQRCGLPHVCPVCSSRIRATRAAELAEAVRSHQRAGGGVAFLTLTVPHRRGDELGELLDGLPSAFRRVLSGRAAAAMRERFGSASVRVLELTHGANGWHAHYHAVLFVGEPLDDQAEGELAEWWRERWADACEAVGLRRPSDERGVLLEAVGGDGGAVAAYVGKVGRAVELGLAAEVARGDLKQSRGRSLWQLAQLAADGDAGARKLWAEYERAIKGRRLFSWSKGLRARLKLAAEPSDAELAAEDAGRIEETPAGHAPEFVCAVAAWQLAQLGRQGRIAELLAAALKGRRAVAELLHDLRRAPPKQRRQPDRVRIVQ